MADEMLGASIMDRNLPGGKVLAGKYLQNKKVYGSDGKEYIVTKFKKTKTGFPVHAAGMGPSAVVPSKNLISLKNPKTGNPVTFTSTNPKTGKKEKSKEITVEEFNRIFSLEKPGKTFKTYKEEKKILSPEEYPIRKAEAEKYAVELGYTVDMDSDKKNEILAKVYEKYPELKRR